MSNLDKYLARKNNMIKPFNKRLLIVRKEAEAETESGIIIPEEARQIKINEGLVADVSEGCKIETGQYVVFNEYSGSEVAWGGVPYLVLPEEEVIAILEAD